MPRPEASAGPTFSHPVRALTIMLGVTILVAVGGWLIHGEITDILYINPVLNGAIVLVFVLGVIATFWQVLTLAKSVHWIERRVEASAASEALHPPALLAPLAALLRSRGSRRMAIPSSSARSILDSVAQRLDEGRDITRYLGNLLVFLGLLGTFWGLATTVPAVVETIRTLAPGEGESGMVIFSRLLQGLEGQLGGMGTAFSSSLLGLGGSLVIGLLDLFAGNGQNRFYRELEEWLASITRIGLSDGEGGASDQSAIVLVLDQMVIQLESLQTLQAEADQARAQMDARLGDLGAAILALSQRLGQNADDAAQTHAALQHLAQSQDRLVGALEASREASDQGDAESRMRLRSIDVQMLRILEEMSAGRQESLADLRSDLGALTTAIRQMSRGAVPPGGRG